MFTRQEIKSIPLYNGKLYGIAGNDRRMFAECMPVIKIYRQDNPVPVLGVSSNVLKSYHAMLAFCGRPELLPGFDYNYIQKITQYELSGNVLLRGNEIKALHFDRLCPEEIDPRGEWIFSIPDDMTLIDKLLDLKLAEM